MAGAEKSFLGLAKQTAKSAENTTDAAFKYLLFRQGGVGPNNVVIPLENEVGGGALARSMAKVAVNSGGALDLVPRPDTLGDFFYGVTGAVTTTVDTPVVTYNTHVFKLSTDQFAAPYYTVRSAPGQLWGEIFQDCRINALTLDWRAADFVRASVGIVGGLPKKAASIASWNALAQVDGGSQFLAPYGAIELPTGTTANVLSGSFIAMSEIPLDQQYVVGQFEPQDLDIVGRSFALSMVVKIVDETLYTKMMYDPSLGAAWTADIFREANFNLHFGSDQANYDFKIEANGQSSADANVLWSAAPLGLRARRQIVMQVSALFTQSPDAVTYPDPITLTLVNQTTSY